MKVIARAFDGRRMVEGGFDINVSDGSVSPHSGYGITSRQESLLFTEVYDGDGRMVYEHDLMRRTYPDGREVVGVVVFETGAFYLKLKNGKVSYLAELIPPANRMTGKAYATHWTICGTYEQNPDLLVVPEEQSLHSRVVAVMSEASFADDQMTTEGKPKVEVIEEVLGEPITAEDRDKAWATYSSL